MTLELPERIGYNPTNLQITKYIPVMSQEMPRVGAVKFIEAVAMLTTVNFLKMWAAEYQADF